MAVECVYRSTYNQAELFMTRSEADKYDLMLETAEHLAAVFQHVLPNLPEQDAEKLSIFLAERRDALVAALKKNPAGIKALIEEPADTANGNVVQLSEAS